MLPYCIDLKPETNDNNVDFPQPDGPIMTANSPFETSKLTSFNTTVCLLPDLYACVIPLTESGELEAGYLLKCIYRISGV